VHDVAATCDALAVWNALAAITPTPRRATPSSPAALWDDD
jgi:hypothetical protein